MYWTEANFGFSRLQLRLKFGVLLQEFDLFPIFHSKLDSHAHFAIDSFNCVTFYLFVVCLRRPSCQFLFEAFTLSSISFPFFDVMGNGPFVDLMPVLGERCSRLPVFGPTSRLLQLVICPEKLCASAIVALLQPPSTAYKRLKNGQKLDRLQQDPVSFSYTTTHDAS